MEKRHHKSAITFYPNDKNYSKEKITKSLANTRYTLIQPSSFTVLSNGNRKRRRQKQSYIDLYLEKKNYLHYIYSKKSIKNLNKTVNYGHRKTFKLSFIDNGKNKLNKSFDKKKSHFRLDTNDNYSYSLSNEKTKKTQNYDENLNTSQSRNKLMISLNSDNRSPILDKEKRNERKIKFKDLKEENKSKSLFSHSSSRNFDNLERFFSKGKYNAKHIPYEGILNEFVVNDLKEEKGKEVVDTSLKIFNDKNGKLNSIGNSNNIENFNVTKLSNEHNKNNKNGAINQKISSNNNQNNEQDKVSRINNSIKGDKSFFLNNEEHKLSSINSTLEGINSNISMNKNQNNDEGKLTDNSKSRDIKNFSMNNNQNNEEDKVSSINNTKEGNNINKCMNNQNNKKGNLTDIDQSKKTKSFSMNKNQKNEESKVSSINNTKEGINSKISMNNINQKNEDGKHTDINNKIKGGKNFSLNKTQNNEEDKLSNINNAKEGNNNNIPINNNNQNNEENNFNNNSNIINAKSKGIIMHNNQNTKSEKNSKENKNNDNNNNNELNLYKDNIDDFSNLENKNIIIKFVEEIMQNAKNTNQNFEENNNITSSINNITSKNQIPLSNKENTKTIIKLFKANGSTELKKSKSSNYLDSINLRHNSMNKDKIILNRRFSSIDEQNKIAKSQSCEEHSNINQKKLSSRETPKFYSNNSANNKIKIIQEVKDNKKQSKEKENSKENEINKEHQIPNENNSTLDNKEIKHQNTKNIAGENDEDQKSQTYLTFRQSKDEQMTENSKKKSQSSIKGIPLNLNQTNDMKSKEEQQVKTKSLTSNNSMKNNCKNSLNNNSKSAGNELTSKKDSKSTKRGEPNMIVENLKSIKDRVSNVLQKLSSAESLISKEKEQRNDKNFYCKEKKKLFDDYDDKDKYKEQEIIENVLIDNTQINDNSNSLIQNVDINNIISNDSLNELKEESMEESENDNKYKKKVDTIKDEEYIKEEEIRKKDKEGLSSNMNNDDNKKILSNSDSLSLNIGENNNDDNKNKLYNSDSLSPITGENNDKDNIENDNQIKNIRYLNKRKDDDMINNPNNTYFKSDSLIKGENETNQQENLGNNSSSSLNQNNLVKTSCLPHIIKENKNESSNDIKANIEEDDCINNPNNECYAKNSLIKGENETNQGENIANNNNNLLKQNNLVKTISTAHVVQKNKIESGNDNIANIENDNKIKTKIRNLNKREEDDMINNPNKEYNTKNSLIKGENDFNQQENMWDNSNNSLKQNNLAKTISTPHVVQKNKKESNSDNKANRKKDNQIKNINDLKKRDDNNKKISFVKGEFETNQQENMWNNSNNSLKQNIFFKSSSTPHTVQKKKNKTCYDIKSNIKNDNINLLTDKSTKEILRNDLLPNSKYNSILNKLNSSSKEKAIKKNNDDNIENNKIKAKKIKKNMRNSQNVEVGKKEKDQNILNALFSLKNTNELEMQKNITIDPLFQKDKKAIKWLEYNTKEENITKNKILDIEIDFKSKFKSFIFSPKINNKHESLQLSSNLNFFDKGRNIPNTYVDKNFHLTQLKTFLREEEQKKEREKEKNTLRKSKSINIYQNKYYNTIHPPNALDVNKFDYFK